MNSSRRNRRRRLSDHFNTRLEYIDHKGRGRSLRDWRVVFLLSNYQAVFRSLFSDYVKGFLGDWSCSWHWHRIGMEFQRIRLLWVHSWLRSQWTHDEILPPFRVLIFIHITRQRKHCLVEDECLYSSSLFQTYKTYCYSSRLYPSWKTLTSIFAWHLDKKLPWHWLHVVH